VFVGEVRGQCLHWLSGRELSAQSHWHVLHTNSRQEKILSDTLAAMGVAHYLPLVRQTRFYGKRKASVEVPLFAGYVFLHGTLEEVYEADRTGRVARIIHVADQEELDRELNNVHLALSKNAELSRYPLLKTGVKVEVRSGPFRGLQGVIENWSRGDLLYLRVQMLGTAARMQIDASLLDPLD
jgi:transcription termination/antitermination protein NusG